MGVHFLYFVHAGVQYAASYMLHPVPSTYALRILGLWVGSIIIPDMTCVLACEQLPEREKKRQKKHDGFSEFARRGVQNRECS